MNTQNQDQLIYDKASKKVNRKNLLVFLLILVYFTSLYILFQMDFFTTSQASLNNVYIGSALSQICLYAMIFLLLSFGKKFFRTMYWLGFLYSLVLLYVPVHFLLKDYFHVVTYGVWIILQLLFLNFIYRYGKSLKTNKWCKIFFDLELEMEEGEDLDQTYHLKYKNEQDTFKKEEEKKEYDLPQISLRLGITIYASLMVFPILLQIFSSWFASIDLQSVFATRDIFIFCIFSALIWTFPVFFFYYDHPYSKKITYGCLAVELARIIAYSFTFMKYYTSSEYSIRVFILFILVDVIRYALLIHSLFPIFSMEMPEFEENDEYED